jgi:peptide/nickel transport system ATP-binding protein
MTETLLEVCDLSVTFETPSGPLRALSSIDFSVTLGETLALVGESGSGKSTVAMAIIGLLTPEAKVSGSVRVAGRDMMNISEAERRKLRGPAVSIVFQDPFTSLNPGLTVGRQVSESLVYHLQVSQEEALERTVQTLEEVGLPDPKSLLSAYPHQLSGGMQQRVLIASALICDPKLLILDEPTTALDVTVEARILDLLDEIRQRRGLGILFITHNLGVVNRIAERVCVLYAGRVAEVGSKYDVLASPAHPYTKGLLASLPTLILNERRSRLAPIPGRLPDMTDLPTGCVFQPRCPFSEERCVLPQGLVEVDNTRRARCWKAESLLEVPWEVPEQDHPGAPASSAATPAAGTGELVATDLVKTFVGGRIGGMRWERVLGLPWPAAVRREIRAVNGVSMRIAPGEVLGLVGESGSGKSTLGRLLTRLVDTDAGRIVYDGEDVTDRPERRLKTFRGKAQVIFQNPDSSLNPRKTVGEAIARALLLHTEGARAGRRERVGRILERVGLPRSYLSRYPHQLSGGERQRVGVARALATQPSFIMCDEPTSALDVSVQATVLNLLADLREQEGLSYLFISHDLSVVSHVSDRIAVMYAGEIVEIGRTKEVLEPPYHPYTEALLSAIQLPDPRLARRERITLRTDTVPSGQEITGCPFHPRCPRKLGKICETTRPPVVQASKDHSFTCHIPLEQLAKVRSPLATGPSEESRDQTVDQ